MKKQIDYIMNKFNFERVHVAMTAVDWKWVNDSGEPGHSVPTIARLKAAAKRLLQTAANEKTTTGSGGLQAKYCPPEGSDEAMLVLSFVLNEIDSEYYDCGY